MTDMRTPLGKVRGLGSARDGTGHFWRQRLTALANIPLIICFVVFVIILGGQDHAAVLEAFRNPLVAVIMLLVILSGIIHMRLGMQVIIEDYISNEGLKVLVLIANTFFCALIGIACIYSILKLGFGG